MIPKRLLQYLLLACTALVASLPAQAAMVGTAQMQPSAIVQAQMDATQQREWIRAELIKGGVDAGDAVKRVAAMTDTQVAMVHQRMHEMPAGGAEALIIIALILVITEVFGYTDIIPHWPAE